MSEIRATSANAENDVDDVENINASDDEAQDGGGGAGGGGGGGGGGLASYFIEGYTPLNINMNALVMMEDDDSEGDTHDDGDGDDANSDEEMDGDLFAAGYYHMMGAPPRRLNGVKDRVIGFSVPHDNEEDSASSHLNESDSGNGRSRVGGNEDSSSPPGSVGVPDDFHLLAEQALRGLEVEHSSTLGRSVDVGASLIDDTYGGNKHPTNISTDFEACFPSFDETHGERNAQAVDEQSGDLASAAPPQKGTPKRKVDLVAFPKIQVNEQHKTSSSNLMDVNAIQKAMQTIRLKSPQLATTLDAGASSSFSTNEAHVATGAALAAVLNSTSQAIEQSRNQQLVSHSIIPSGPLAAFRRTTPKAQAASANLTRSATLSESVLRLWPLICFRRRMRATGLGRWPAQDTNHCLKALVIHILGSDGVECSSEESVRKSVGPFVRWLDAALRSGLLEQSQDGLDKMATTGMPAHYTSTGIDTLLIEFSGPNMPNSLIGEVFDLMTQSNSQSAVGLASARVIFRRREYHEAPSCTDGVDAASADLAIAFNAGIWGYDSWKPTIAHMCQSGQLKSFDVKGIGSAANHNSGIGKTLFVITAYTVEECEDDAEVIADVVEKVAAERSSSTKNDLGTVAQQLWAPEANPFSSRLERKTASAPPGRKYYENGAWQAWLLGL